VAATRARDHLVVSTFHQVDDASFASRVWREAQDVPDLWSPLAPTQRASGPRTPAGAGPPEGEQLERHGWIAARRHALDDQRMPRVVSATAIARSDRDRAGAVDVDDDLDVESADDVDEEVAGPGRAARPTTRGRAGTALGRAVHGVLQQVDLATGDGLDDLAVAQAGAESVPELADEIAVRARAALAAPVVRAAASGAPYWREIYVGAPVTAEPEGSGPPVRGDGLVIEGYVDLLVETDDGLVVVDHKTDGVRGDAEVDQAVARYRLQGAAYALAVQQLVRRPVVDCQFVFLGPGGAVCRSVADLGEAMAEVGRRATPRSPGSARAAS
jgi:ATP-dependent helicase/nuclease subunit A